VPGYQRYCRWHDPRYPADGPFWRYLSDEECHLCPTFKVLANTQGSRHPSHVTSNPIIPYYSYSMNFALGVMATAPKLTNVTRTPSQVIFFAEENMWARPGCANVLNDNALCGDGRDWLGTFHGSKRGDWNAGTANAVFVDCHVEGKLRSALKDNPSDTSEMEFGRYEKFFWPLKKKP